MKINIGEQYGDYKVIKKFKSKDKRNYGCRCISCGDKKKFTKNDLLHLPYCEDCRNELSKNSKEQRHNAVDISDKVKQLDKKLKDNTMLSMFKDQVQEITSKLGKEGNNLDAQTDFQLTTLHMLLDLVPIAESAYRANPKQSNMLTLNSVVDQISDILEDLLNKSAKSDIINKIIVDYLDPLFKKEISSDIINCVLELREIIHSRMDAKDWKKISSDMDEIVRVTLRTIHNKIQVRLSTVSDEIL